FPGLQGGPHNHPTAGIAGGLGEPPQPWFRRYAHRIGAKAKPRAGPPPRHGFTLAPAATANHLILSARPPKGIDGKPAAKALDAAGIELNFNTVPFDPRKPWSPSGIRLGTPALTTRGLTEKHMPAIAAWMDEAVTAGIKEDTDALARIAAEV